MAKQLEEALKRPASPVAPPPAAPASAGPRVTVHEDISDEDDLLEPSPADQDAAAPYEPFEDEDLVEEHRPAPAPASEPPRPVEEPVRSALPPAPPAPPAPPQAAEAPAAPQAPAKTPDPFSVEEIEAEFARLLGRPLDTGKKG
jgi:hypothetical protein